MKEKNGLLLSLDVLRGFDMSFNGAGVSMISPLYATKFAEYSIAKVIPRQRRKVTRK